jgi:hypothetical protein
MERREFDIDIDELNVIIIKYLYYHVIPQMIWSHIKFKFEMS